MLTVTARTSRPGRRPLPRNAAATPCWHQVAELRTAEVGEHHDDRLAVAEEVGEARRAPVLVDERELQRQRAAEMLVDLDLGDGGRRAKRRPRLAFLAARRP